MPSRKRSRLEVRELEALRKAVDKIEQREGSEVIKRPLIQKAINIVEKFLRKTKRICYGGTAINNILPHQDRFYDKRIELPDYDFFSPKPLQDAKALANIYYRQGYTDVEAKAGVHDGTFKVFVDFIPIADITYLVPELYKSLQKYTKRVGGIYYAPPNYLRMAMYLELSRPKGDVSRWEKVLKRLLLLNKAYPLDGKGCTRRNIQRRFDPASKMSDKEERQIATITRHALADLGVVFFGALADSLYLKHLPRYRRPREIGIPDFDVLAEHPQLAAKILKERLVEAGLRKISISQHKGIGEIIAPHYEVRVEKETVAFIYEPLACHSYNLAKVGGRYLKIATIDTMLSLYLAFLYAKRPYYNTDRLLCMAHFLLVIQAKNRLGQKGVLRRFSINCYGPEVHTIAKMRLHKAAMYQKLKNKRGTKEWEWYFLHYQPAKDLKTKGRKSTRKKKRGRRRSSKRVPTWGRRAKNRRTRRKRKNPKSRRKAVKATRRGGGLGRHK